MDDLDLAINGLWLSGLRILAWMGKLAQCVLLAPDLIRVRTREHRAPIGIFGSFLLLGVVVGRRWRRAELRPA